jgi:cytochrome c
MAIVTLVEELDSMKYIYIFPCMVIVSYFSTLGSSLSSEENIDISTYESAVKSGNALWADTGLGKQSVTCSQCHPNAAGIDAASFPKFHDGLKNVAQLHEVVNWCIQHALKGEKLPSDERKMTALIAYIMSVNSGKKLTPGKLQ